MRVLVTGAAGKLGRNLTPLLAPMYDVRGLSRRERRPADIEWVVGDLRTGEGIERAVEGVDVIVHAATHGGLSADKMRLRYLWRHPGHTDVEGTRKLVDAARAANVKHFVYTSIVGIEKVPIGYWGSKLRAEGVVASSGVPYTFARITQFHDLVDAAIRYALRYPFALLPRNQRVQPIDVGDAGRLTATLVDRPASNGIIEFGGPEATTYGDAADSWLEDRKLRRRIGNLPVPGRIGRALKDGALCTPDHSGTISWSQWLRAHPKEAT